MRVLITGGAGFIGTATTRALVPDHDVTVLDSFSEQIHGDAAAAAAVADELALVADVVRGDVRDRDVLAELVRGADVVLHLAAETGTGQSMYDISHHTEVNVGGTARLLEAVTTVPNGVRRLVVASSRSIYGEGSYRCPVDGVVHPVGRDAARLRAGRFDPACPHCGRDLAMIPTAESAALHPASVYAATKLAQENLVLAVARSRGLPAYALRYQNVYGSGQALNNPYTGILAVFAREMMGGRPVELFEDGDESRDFVHVTDVAAANVAAITSDRRDAVALNIGAGRAVRVVDVARALARELDHDGEITISGRFRAGDIRHNVADVERAREVLGFRPRVAFEDGLAEFCAWARASLAGAAQTSRYRESLAELEARGLMSAGGGPAGAAPDPT